MKITLCVSVPNNGADLLRLLVESAARTRSGAHAVDVHFTCHEPALRDAVQAAGLPLPIGRVHIVPREPPGFFHANSITHSRCINALYRGLDADADIGVICDYDGAFVARDWDLALVDALVTRGLAFFGSPYSATAATEFKLPGARIEALKYQGRPNCIFLALRTAVVRPLTDRVCDFADAFGAREAVPLKLVATPQDAACYGLPVGSFLHIDTGLRVVEVAARAGLATGTLERRTHDYQVVRLPKKMDRKCPDVLRPEEYFHDGRPFFVHFRKAGSKGFSFFDRWKYDPEQFAGDVRAYLAATPPRRPG
jgi:hypothetical protein